MLASDTKAKLFVGPTAPKPGPMFIRAEMAALIALGWSMPSITVDQASAAELEAAQVGIGM